MQLIDFGAHAVRHSANVKVIPLVFITMSISLNYDEHVHFLLFSSEILKFANHLLIGGCGAELYGIRCQVPKAIFKCIGKNMHRKICIRVKYVLPLFKGMF